MNEAPHLLVTIDEGILTATLNRPEKLNALSDETLRLFEQALFQFRDTSEVKVLLIRATGRYFCSGADLIEDGQGIPATGSAIREVHRLKTRGMRRIYDEMEAIEKPIVVAHQGTCMGGGLEMSLSCDFRLAAARASYAFPEGRFGVLPASNGVSRLSRIVGPHWARYMVMAGLEVDANRALIMGLVHEVYADETFDADVMGFCRHLAKQNGEQMGVAKLAIEMATDVGLAQASRIEQMANSALMLMPDFQEGMKAYVGRLGKGGRGPG